MNLKSGDRIRYKDNDKRVFTVHTVYSKELVSLGLFDYPDIEQDYKTDIRNIIKLDKTP